MKMWVATQKHVIYEKYIWPDNVNMFCEKALLVNIIRSRSLNTCISRELALQKEGNIFVKRMYHLIRIYLSQFEVGRAHATGGGPGGHGPPHFFAEQKNKKGKKAVNELFFCLSV